jgi:hypothetical protein
MARTAGKEKRGRPKKYGADVHAALAQIWDAMEHPCAENMTYESADEYVASFVKEKRWSFGNETTENLLIIDQFPFNPPKSPASSRLWDDYLIERW